ncbi:hypothetical protein DYB26_006999 [Aphanomyces astaci]|uniref:Mnd1 HTH domain-containing protein n=1 Tax=Aphanomyces astaci TaxID=112090 RepID=A0A3R7C2S0_APHAT|nr:hypothetical protein DYB26_006999 [Aphanomyces astaci]
MAKAKGPALTSIKQRALQTLKRKKMYEQQRDSMAAQSFNIEQVSASFAIETAKDSLDTVSAMKSAATQLKAETKKFNFAELENVQDDMADMMDDMNEIQEILGSVGQDIDESELEAELEGLEDEWAMEEAVAPQHAAPSYLATDLPAAPTGVKDKSTAAGVDEYGLPLAPVALRKRKKGVSLDEKRERILKIYHDNLEVYNLKEVEKLGSKAGVVLQTIKDVNQALVDDNLVDTEKIGSGNYFWSFPSKVAQQRKRKLEDLEAKRSDLKGKIESTKQAVAAQKSLRTDSDDRVVKLERLALLKSQIEEANRRMHVLSENDPDVESSERGGRPLDWYTHLHFDYACTSLMCDVDNVFNLKSWIIKKNSCSSAEVSLVEKWLGIKDDFDYVE